MDGSPREAKEDHKPLNYRFVALIVACAIFMEQLDATVLATALPTMARDFGVPEPSISIALTSYLLALAIFIPVSGRLADRFGSRAIFEAGIILFLAGSVLCSQAVTLPIMVLTRFIQGLGGAVMIPIGRLVVLQCVDKRDMVSAMSWLIMPAMIGPLIGPPFGGFIVTYLDWRWIFYFNIPIGIIGVILVRLFIYDVGGTEKSSFDFLGFVLTALSLGCLLFGFELMGWKGHEKGALLLVGIGLVAGFVYARYANTQDDPILDLTLIRIPSFRLSVIAGSLTRITQGAQPFLLPLLLQLGFGLTAAASGTITIAVALGSVSSKPMAAWLFSRFGFRRMLIVNGVVSGLSYASCALFRPGWPLPLIFGILFVSGAFMSFQFTAYNTIAFDEIPRERMSASMSFYATFQQLTLSLGICIGSLALELAMLFGGRTVLNPADFSWAFLIVTSITLSATYWHCKFAPDAGAELSGYVRKPR